MINSMQEIEERFDRIKDHKPKAVKKLNELGDILASAYKIEPEQADAMWQYIVELNVTENVGNAKFYIAQIFNKIIDRLSTEEATELITMTPDRVYLMIMHGYEGGTLWKCLGTLLKGYISLEAIDNAAVCMDMFYEKFGGIDSISKGVIDVARHAVEICAELIDIDDSRDQAEEFLKRLMESRSEDVNRLVKLFAVAKRVYDPQDFSELLQTAITYKCPEEFYDLMWFARREYSQEELRDLWVDYVENCDENDKLPCSYYYDPDDEQRIARQIFYSELEQEAPELLNCYFNRQNIQENEINIIRNWMDHRDWDSFVKYVSLSVMALNEDSFSWCRIKTCIEKYMEICFYPDYMDSSDAYCDSYKKFMESRKIEFAEALAKISMITVGCECHSNFHAVIKAFIEKLTGSVELLNSVGFSEENEVRTPEERLKEYVHDFLKSGKCNHEQSSTQYSIIEKALRDEILSLNRTSDAAITRNSTINVHIVLNGEGSSESHTTFETDAVNEEPKEKIDYALEQAYRMAFDDEIAEFYFAHFSSAYQKRTDMLSACIRKNNINRAMELVDIMASTKGNPGYEDLNGWGRQNMLTLLYIINKYDFGKADSWENQDITDEMRNNALHVVMRMVPHLSKTAKEEIKHQLFRLNYSDDDIAAYINELLEDAEVYSTFPRPKEKDNAPNINRMSSEFISCFDRLSKLERQDVICEIMKRFASVKDILGPVTYDRWISFMTSGVSDQSLLLIFKYSPEIFEAWLEMDNVDDADICKVAKKIGMACTREEYAQFRTMIVNYKGLLPGIDSCYKSTSDNTETQLLYDGKYAKLELDYLTIDFSNYINQIRLNIKTSIKEEFDSVRVAKCLINGKTARLRGYTTFDDGFPDGYRVYNKSSDDALWVESDFFTENKIKQIDKMVVFWAIMDSAGRRLGTIIRTTIVHNISSGEYEVRSE